MSNEPRFSVPGSHRTLPPRALRQGSVGEGETIEVTLRLRSRAAISPAAPAASGLAVTARELGAPLSREAFEAAHGADPDDLRRTEDFAHEHHLTVVESSAARRTVIVSGSLADLQAAFGVTLHRYTLDGQTFRGRSGDVSVPQELAGVIEGVFGLDDRPQARTHFRLASSGPAAIVAHAASVSFTPPELARAYNFPAGVDGHGQTIAIIELGGGYRKRDLDTYFHGLGLSTPRVSAVSVNGGRNAPTGDPGGPDGEVMLDIEVAGAVAPGARIVVYFAPNTDAGFLNAVTQATHDRLRAPSIMSISWGAAESAWTGQATQAMSSAFQDAAMMGISVFCAAGDNGSSDNGSDGGSTDEAGTDGVSGGPQHTDFPASSPWVTGCGGTRLTVQDGLPVSEVVWNNGPGNGATGGGVSDVFPLPGYQSGAGVPPSANPGGRVGRGVPDVSGVADPQTGYRVRVDGTDTVIGGTSAVAPLWAGLSALLNQALGRPVGFLNPQLYALAPVRGTAVRDIVTGNNGAYSAGPGWDACTGLGSPDGERLLAALGGAAGAGPPGPEEG
ncbi:protease pro-enzyme activation domain-containing protein [Deinococcus altitudinis]|uniref:S53 family peptidase n=1 Tax=Deinococcus altitudinis TaxID=468914 RepID=UPI0038919B35